MGQWRERYENNREVDPSGMLFRKHEFSNAVEFKEALLVERDRFARAFAKHLLSFALSREITAADSVALDQIVSETVSEGYKMRSLIRALVSSEQFLKKSNPKALAAN